MLVEAYRVLPLSARPPEVGEHVLAFEWESDAWIYVWGWYGESCILYKLEGLVEEDSYTEDVQIEVETPIIDVQVFKIHKITSVVAIRVLVYDNNRLQ
jgi:hypothetical protein